MVIGKIASQQSFRGTNDSQRKSFMGQLNDVLDTTSKTTGELADLVIATKSALDTPEEATMRVLNNQLENVANNDKLPKWMKKAATGTCAVLISGLTFVATKKVLKAPGQITNFVKNQLIKTNTGASVVNFAATMKDNFIKVAKKLNIGAETFSKAKTFFGCKAASALNFVKNKFPKITSFVDKFNDYTKLKPFTGWFKKHYVENTIASIMALSSGKKFIDKKSATENAKVASTTQKEATPEIRDAA